jgi:hypothetical protein
VLRPSEDRKVQGRNGQLNTFGLLPGLLEEGGTCPGLTEGPQACRSCQGGKTTWHCYAARLARFRPAIHSTLRHNTELLVKAKPSGKEQLLCCEFIRFLEAEQRATKPWLYYRLHWAGDIFDEEYADALRSAISRFPEISFWGYTRSFWAAPVLAGLKNCMLYLSLDDTNREEGERVWSRNRRAGNIKLSIMAKERPTGYIACPVDAGRMPQEQSCSRCRICLKGRPVWFYLR